MFQSTSSSNNKVISSESMASLSTVITVGTNVSVVDSDSSSVSSMLSEYEAFEKTVFLCHMYLFSERSVFLLTVQNIPNGIFFSGTKKINY